MKIMHIVGARPNFMKIAPIMSEMNRYDDHFEQVLVHTGQHYDRTMSQVFFDELELPHPDINLDVRSGSHAQQTAEIMKRFEPVLLDYRPDWLFVPGDVNSTLACALVAAKSSVPIVHVEAGLRSYDRTMPEEINRILTDHLSDMLLTPSRDGDENLLKEGIPPQKIHFVGNIMIDTLVRLLPKAQSRYDALKKQYELQSFILVTLHRPANVDNDETLQGILEAVHEIGRHAQVLFPVHPRTRSNLAKSEFQPLLRNILLLEPLGYLDFLALQSAADVVVTDSGGVQEETTFLGVPCVTVRPNTERPVTLTQGTNRLVSSDCQSLIHAISDSLSSVSAPDRQVPERWDGKTASRIVQIFL